MIIVLRTPATDGQTTVMILLMHQCLDFLLQFAQSNVALKLKPSYVFVVLTVPLVRPN